MADEQGKDLVQTRSGWGVFFLLLAVGLKALGHEAFDPDLVTEQFLKLLDYLLPLIGAVVSFFGIVNRKQPVSSILGIPLEKLRKFLPFLVLLALPGIAAAMPTTRPEAGANTWCLAGASGWCNSALRAPHSAFGAIECPDPRMAVDLPADVRGWYRNPDGSCVQCSGGMIGTDQNVPAAATLLWDTEYGPAERGGSGSSRVSRYAKSRGINIYNVTGRATLDWMKWACATGRGAAIGAGGSHFQTLMGYDPSTGTWYVCNNNSTGKIDEYTEEGFRRLHAASGPWIWILDYPPHPTRPYYVNWWD